MSITRRDFLNGVAITIAAGVAPINLLKAAEGGSTLADKTLAYPPALTGLRGNLPGSFEPAHSIARDGKQYDFANIPLEGIRSGDRRRRDQRSGRCLLLSATARRG